MSIVILDLGSEQGPHVSAIVRHDVHEFTALINGSKADLADLIGKECIVEMLFETVASWKELHEFQDDQSCIMASAATPGATTLQGRVHNISELGENSHIIDLYLQNGPEFLALSSAELNGAVPALRSALEVTVHGLCFYPTGA
ncbi:MAG: hypothetical protein Q7T55_12615 [Solirubrobacteraceae bacterium]|nr:hypothetical protein [Solirubrobacteraceae bacterium]